MARGAFLIRRDPSGSWGPPTRLRAGTSRVSWSPDGRFLAYAHRGAVEILLTDSDGPRVVFAPRVKAIDPVAESVQVAFDSRTLYFKSHDERGRASLWSYPSAAEHRPCASGWTTRRDHRAGRISPSAPIGDIRHRRSSMQHLGDGRLGSVTRRTSLPSGRRLEPQDLLEQMSMAHDRTTTTQHVTTLLAAWSDGDEGALQQLIPLVHRQLRGLARRAMLRERGDHTLQPTALVNELYLRLVDVRQVQWNNRAHFYALSARLMRRVLVDLARSKGFRKRGGGAPSIEFVDDRYVPATRHNPDLEQLDAALVALEAIDPRRSQVVESDTSAASMSTRRPRCSKCLAEPCFATGRSRVRGCSGRCAGRPTSIGRAAIGAALLEVVGDAVMMSDGASCWPWRSPSCPA